MLAKMLLFTLHDDEKNLRIEGAVVARSPYEAASILGGEFMAVAGWPMDSSTNKDDLSLVGRIRFARELFRGYSEEAIAQIGYAPAPYYAKQGFRIAVRQGEVGRTFVLRVNPVVLPDYAISSD